MSCNMCTVTAKTSNVPGIVISQMTVLQTFRPITATKKRFVRSTSSRLTPVKHNTTTIKQLLSISIKLDSFFPTFLRAQLSDQDRTAHVASFCTLAPNICESAVRNVVHATLLTPGILKRLIIFFFFSKFINPRSKSSCTLHTNLHRKTNETKIWTTTAYGYKTSLLRQHENTSANEKTNNSKQL
jgi:hypothetical protein